MLRLVGKSILVFGTGSLRNELAETRALFSQTRYDVWTNSISSGTGDPSSPTRSGWSGIGNWRLTKNSTPIAVYGRQASWAVGYQNKELISIMANYRRTESLNSMQSGSIGEFVPNELIGLCNLKISRRSMGIVVCQETGPMLISVWRGGLAFSGLCSIRANYLLIALPNWRRWGFGRS